MYLSVKQLLNINMLRTDKYKNMSLQVYDEPNLDTVSPSLGVCVVSPIRYFISSMERLRNASSDAPFSMPF